MKLLFLNILADDSEMMEKLDKEVHGCPYPELFRRGMRLENDQFIPVNAVAYDRIPAFGQFDGVVIGGSIFNPIVGEERPWMKRVYNFIRETTIRRIPMLGVCGGHQFIARALGGNVVYNPKGREFGTREIWLTCVGKHDMLFHGLPERFRVQLSHQCMVSNPPENWQILASSDICDVQALAPNFYTRTVQFHLELGASHIKKIALMRKFSLIKEGFVKNEDGLRKFIPTIRQTHYAAKILQNFVRYFVAPLAMK